MMFKKSIAVMLVLCIVIGLCACGGETKQEAESADKTIKLGVLPTSGPMMEWIKEDMEKEGYTVEIVTFTENQQPAVALSNDDIDGFIVNQLIWLNEFNESNNTDLKMLEPYIYYPGYGAYSSKYDKIDDIPENAEIVIPGNPVNMERALLILQHMGLIKLGDKLGSFYATTDIEENYKNIKLIEMEQIQVASSINDVDAVICTSTTVKDAGFDARKFLFEDPDAKNYPISLVVQPKDTDSPWAREVLKICQSDKFRKNFDEYFEGTRILFDVEKK